MNCKQKEKITNEDVFPLFMILFAILTDIESPPKKMKKKVFFERKQWQKLLDCVQKENAKLHPLSKVLNAILSNFRLTKRKRSFLRKRQNILLIWLLTKFKNKQNVFYQWFCAKTVVLLKQLQVLRWQSLFRLRKSMVLFKNFCFS